MRTHDGVAHGSVLYAAGFSKHAVSAAVSSGMLRRVRRSWLLQPDCDPRRAAAAALGGRVTCVSAAALLGLWTPDHDETHIAVAPHAAGGSVRPGLRLHWSDGPAPFPRRAVQDPLINVLYHVARCRPAADALAVWESALRLKLVDLAVLDRVRWRSTRASSLKALASSLSDSGLETCFVMLMRDTGVTVQQQAWIDGRPVDGLIGERLIIQLDGFAYHSSAAERRRDLEADARLGLRGYTVLRFDYQQVFFRPGYVTDVVRTAIAQGLHRPETRGSAQGADGWSRFGRISG